MQKKQKANLEADPKVYSTDASVHLHKVLTEKYAFQLQQTQYHHMATSICGISHLQETISYWPDSLGFQKNSVYKPMFEEV